LKLEGKKPLELRRARTIKVVFDEAERILKNSPFIPSTQGKERKWNTLIRELKAFSEGYSLTGEEKRKTSQLLYDVYISYGNYMLSRGQLSQALSFYKRALIQESDNKNEAHYGLIIFE